MTLSTNVYVLDEIDPMEVFRYCQGLLARFDDERRPAEAQRWTNRQDMTFNLGEWTTEPDNPWSLDNEPDQNLPAWLMMAYRPGAPLRTQADAEKHDPDCCNIPGATFYDESEPLCDGAYHSTACWLDIDFDTAYSYKSGGRGCGDLHAALVGLLGQWLSEKGVTWKWRNEFTGEVHDDAASLVELVTGGADASAWLNNIVKPAINAEVESKGGRVEWS